MSRSLSISNLNLLSRRSGLQAGQPVVASDIEFRVASSLCRPNPATSGLWAYWRPFNGHKNKDPRKRAEYFRLRRVGQAPDKLAVATFDSEYRFSRASLQSFELTRLNHAANLRQEIAALIGQWIQDTSEAMPARWMFNRHKSLQSPPMS